MPGILDRVARRTTPAQYTQFQPSNPDEFFALQLAYRLHEPGAAQHYADLLQHYSVAQLLTAFNRAKLRGSQLDPARSFHDQLARLGSRKVNEIKDRRLAAFRIDRRALAVVVLSGTHLEYPPLIRQLASDSNKAHSSAAAFLSLVMQKCPFRTAALEAVPGNSEAQRRSLAQLVQDLLSQQAIGIWQVPKRDMLAAFGYPPLRFRSQVQEIIEAIWPDMNGGFGAPLISDALALGLYCQTEYLFNL